MSNSKNFVAVQKERTALIIESFVSNPRTVAKMSYDSGISPEIIVKALNKYFGNKPVLMNIEAE